MLHGLVSNKRLIKMLNTEQFFLYSYYSFVKWFFISILPVLFHDVPPLQVRVHLFMLFPVIFILYYFLPTHLALVKTTRKLTNIGKFYIITNFEDSFWILYIIM